MIKKLLYLILLLPFSVMAQKEPAPPGTGTANAVPFTPLIHVGGGDTSAHFKMGAYYFTIPMVAVNPIITGGQILHLPQVGDVIPTGTPDQVWNATYRPPLAPTAAISGGSLSEYSTSNKTHSLSYSYGRQATTATISTAVINPGSFNVFSTQPSQPGTVSGSQPVTTTANTNTTYTITVTASAAPTTATATTTDTWAPGIYYGRAATTTPTASEIVAAAGGGKIVATGHAGSWTVTASGSNHPFIAINATQGSITLIKDVNGFDVTSSFPTTTVSVTNVNGYVANYTCYTLTTATSSNYPFTTN